MIQKEEPMQHELAYTIGFEPDILVSSEGLS